MHATQFCYGSDFPGRHVVWWEKTFSHIIQCCGPLTDFCSDIEPFPLTSLARYAHVLDEIHVNEYAQT
jgi:hypothetical protein